LAGVGITASREEVEALREPFEDPRRRDPFRASGGQLDSEGHLVERTAELADRVVGLVAPRPGDEEVDGVRLGERSNLVFDLAAHAEALSARREHRQVRAGLDEIGER
jgi:hypothetical protein